MKFLKRASDLQAWMAQTRRKGGRIGLVPTMGNLHPGHGTLVKLAQTHCTHTVTSVYVNPLQFGAGEDFDTYPRTLQADRNKLKDWGCDVLFAPTTEEMYPDGLAKTTVIRAGALGRVLEGRARPTHFDGVLTIINRLFSLCPADYAVFGQKDFQQQWLIRRFAAKAFAHMNILTAPTHREPSGLAMSSRNSYLTDSQKAQAVAISQALRTCCTAIAAGARQWAQLEQSAQTRIAKAGLVPDYVAIRMADTLRPPTQRTQIGTPLVVLAAAKLDKTRLLDNYVCTIGTKDNTRDP